MEDTLTDSLMGSMMALNADSRSRCRGIVVDDDGDLVSPVSETYLHVLGIEMLRAWSQAIIATAEDKEDEDAEERLTYVCFEMKRLLNHPELFSTNESRVRLLSLMALDVELQFQTACATLILKAELDAIESDTEADHTRPTYANELNGWENFLLNMAPGAPSDPTDRAHTMPKTSFQLLPPVGMRIVSDLEREEKDIQRYLEDRNKEQGINATATATATTMMINFDRQTSTPTELPLLSLPQQAHNATVRPNPYRSISGSKPQHATNSLRIEDIGTFVHKLEHAPPPPHQPLPSLHDKDVFPQIALRTWHPPARLQDIRYDHAAR